MKGTLGARLFLCPPDSASIGLMIRVGLDFPISARLQLEALDISMVMVQENDRLSTRGELIYTDSTYTGND